jgi:HemY protein
MRRILVYVIITILVAGWIGNMVAHDPGYVLISYDGATLQTSLWVFLGLTGLSILLVLGVVKLLRIFLSTGGAWTTWRKSYKQAKAHENISRGLNSLIEGHWARAQNYLTNSVADSALPMINYLGAALAAQKQGDLAKRDEYFQRAGEIKNVTAAAISISRAQLDMEIGQWQQARDKLLSLPRSARVLELLVRINTELLEWSSNQELLKNLKKTLPKSEYAVLEKQVWQSIFEQLIAKGKPLDNESQLHELRSMWKEVPAELKRDGDILIPYVGNLANANAKTESVAILGKSLKSGWNDRLVDCYGELAEEQPDKQIKVAESWLQKYPDNAHVLLCLGRLYLQSSEYQKARDYLEKSLALERSRDVCLVLGQTMAKLGDHARSNQLYLMAMEEK